MIGNLYGPQQMYLYLEWKSCVWYMKNSLRGDLPVKSTDLNKYYNEMRIFRS